MPTTANARTLPAGFIITICQEIIGYTCRVLLWAWGGYTLTAHLPKTLDRNQRYIIASNHQSRLDPFAVFALLDTRRRRRLLPVKSMTWVNIYYSPLVRPFAYVLGCFPSHHKEHSRVPFGLDASVHFLREGYNIYIAPEGSRTLRKDSDPKSGVSKMLAAFPEANLVLVHLEWRVHSKWRRHLTITVAEAPANLDKSNPKAIMDAIYAL